MDDPIEKKTTTEEAPAFSTTLLRDLQSTDLDLRRDLNDLYRFYLDEEEQAQLAEMNRVQRGVASTYWLLKSMVLKLPPTRRLLLLIAFLFLIFGFDGPTYQLVAGFLTLLVILLLELKDKLLAQDELEAGRTVQIALMPERQPELPGWDLWLYTRPAREVGGDMVDFLRLDDDRMAVSLGDIAGKGLGAALFMSNLQATLRALAPSYATLAELGAQVNKIFCRDTLPGRFASLAYLELSADNGEVRLMNAGHLPPLHVQGPIVTATPHPSPALGLSPKMRYQEHHVHLDPGDLLVIYSDGLTEARDEEGEFFGERRLERLLGRVGGQSARDVGARLLRAVDHFVGDAPATDDLSLVILRRRGPGPKPALLPEATPGTEADPLP